MGRSDAARQLPLDLAAHGGDATERLLVRLRARVGGALEVRVTDNARSMLSVRREGELRRVRAHGMFVDAPDEVIDAVARYVCLDDRRAGARIDRYIRANAHRIRRAAPPTSPVGARGDVHDLAALLAAQVAAHCPDASPVSIAWGRWGTSQRRARVRTIRLGAYRYDDASIRVHPVLDRPWVPDFFVAWVVFHELAHHVTRAELEGGRMRHHTEAFRAFEARYPERERALAWEAANLRRLVAERDG